MIDEIIARIKQKHRTAPFPFKNIKLPDRFKGLPEIKNPPEDKIEELVKLCPVNAILNDNGKLKLDMGLCIFCGKCERKFSEYIRFTKNYSLSVSNREELILSENFDKKSVILRKEIYQIFGHSLKLRQVSAGGCNACEADCNVLSTPFFDMARFGISFVASPRHADGILITGPVTKNMHLALRKTYQAIPNPKVVIAVGSCSISGGIYKGLEQIKGIDKDIKVDLFIPGCPPHPMTILDGLLRFIGKIKS